MADCTDTVTNTNLTQGWSFFKQDGLELSFLGTGADVDKRDDSDSDNSSPQKPYNTFNQHSFSFGGFVGQNNSFSTRSAMDKTSSKLKPNYSYIAYQKHMVEHLRKSDTILIWMYQ